MATKKDLVPKLSIQNVSNMLGISRQAVHSKLRKLGITCKKIGKTSYITHLEGKALFNFKFNKVCMAMQHIKGGVGKTTTADTIGDFYSVLGARVLKVDADLQKNLTFRYNIPDSILDNTPVLIDLINNNGTIKDAIIPVSEGIDLLPSRFENASIETPLSRDAINLSTILDQIFSPIKDSYDIIIFDCPAALGKLVTAITLFSDIVVCPVNPERFSISGLETLKKELIKIQTAYNREVSYKVFLNKYETTTKISKEEEGVRKIVGDLVESGHGYDQAVTKSQEIVNALEANKTIFNYTKKSEVRNDFIELAKQIINFDQLLNSSAS